ncbi:hypothetical protein [Flavobacterium aquiphilum]|uniref:hypothetical protein n=1 Tax=Flavobacterium aquiphilum TaxID=3003261 RepID=UPI002480A8E8|nr:hypothetical protein [Flavobacterium aquiphilum]
MRFKNEFVVENYSCDVCLDLSGFKNLTGLDSTSNLKPSIGLRSSQISSSSLSLTEAIATEPPTSLYVPFKYLFIT